MTGLRLVHELWTASVNHFIDISICLVNTLILYSGTPEINEPHREKTGFLPRRKQRRRSASR